VHSHAINLETMRQLRGESKKDGMKVSVTISIWNGGKCFECKGYGSLEIKEIWIELQRTHDFASALGEQ